MWEGLVDREGMGERQRFKALLHKLNEFECDECARTFPHRSTLNAHKKEKHLPRTLFCPCDHCDLVPAGFVWERDRQRHLWRYHPLFGEPDTPGECTVNDRFFLPRAPRTKRQRALALSRV
jgi:hypothetical protein